VQTWCKLRTRYKEHIESIRYYREDSGFAMHILKNIHCYGKIGDITKKINQTRKGRIMNINENGHIYLHKHSNKLIDETKPVKIIIKIPYSMKPYHTYIHHCRYGTHSYKELADPQYHIL
jgi:hypothetical protein